MTLAKSALIIERDAFLRNIEAQLLGEEGYAVVTVDTVGAVSVHFASMPQPCLLLADEPDLVRSLVPGAIVREKPFRLEAVMQLVRDSCERRS